MKFTNLTCSRAHFTIVNALGNHLHGLRAYVPGNYPRDLSEWWCFACQQRPTHICLRQCRNFPITMPKCNVFRLRDKSVPEFTPMYLHVPANHLDIRSDNKSNKPSMNYYLWKRMHSGEISPAIYKGKWTMNLTLISELKLKKSSAENVMRRTNWHCRLIVMLLSNQVYVNDIAQVYTSRFYVWA